MTTQATIIRFDIIDNQTNKVVATAKTRPSANRKADNRDLKYGAIRYIVKAIWSDAK
jgi:hypothetical protein